MSLGIHRIHALSLTALLCTACATPSEVAPPPAQQPGPSEPTPSPVALTPALNDYVTSVLPEVDGLAADRRAVLDQLATFVRERRAAGEPARLLFICTHNSRRSHMGQLWAATAAAYYGVAGVETFSGGTEATAFNPRAVAALQRAGFAIEADAAGGDNPRYVVRFAEGAPTLEAFSKTWQDEVNPKEGFAAVMTCSQADEACPFVRGSALRVSLPYDDPKAADGTPEEAARYDERARQIAAEMLYLFRAVAG